MTQRVTVTGRQRGRAPVRRRPVTTEIDNQTRLGDVYMRSLLRAQLRLGLTVAGVIIVLLGALPVVFAVAPGVSEIELMSIPLPWVVLGGLVYPVLVGAAWFYVRAAERVERDFAEMVDRR